MNEVHILNNSRYIFRFKKEFNKILNAFANIMKYDKFIEVDVLITNNTEIKKISKDYRKINKETDILSFPSNLFKEAPFLNPIPLGEIILSYEKIKLQATKFNHSIKREICFLFAHGLVHLHGLDHKKSKLEEKEFNQIVYNIMDMVDIRR